MVFVQKIAKIIQVVTAFIDSIVAIAAGNISAASKRVESILAGLLSLAINFLAGFAGLGKIADKIMGVISKVRAPIDKALDALIAWIVKMAKSLFSKVFGKKEQEKKPSDLTPEQRLEGGVAAGDKLLDDPDATLESIRGKLPELQSKYMLKALTLVVDREEEEDYDAHVHGEVNPPKNARQRKVPKSAKTTKIDLVEIPREKMRWLKIPKLKIALKFLASPGAVASAVEKATGRFLTKRKWGRRHIVSFADMADHYKAAFHPKMTVADACEILAKFGEKPKFTKRSVHSKIRSLARRAFNWERNVRIGLQAANSALGRTVDPTDDMIKRGKVVQATLDEHVKAFLLEWAIPGIPFRVTQEQGEVEWEVTEE
jgi:hypothetical protein